MEAGTRKKGRRTSTGAYSGKTKFDKWIDKCVSDTLVCEIVLAPPTPYPYPSGNPENCRFNVFFVESDRYMVKVEFLNLNGDDDEDGFKDEHDGRIWWIAKDAIRAAAGIS